ncbi:MAG: hypothetical protein EP341_00015 [Sphingomonadales bacterium]|nr:MAG: hypothetical protein EP341_00015 [Sphingomonadales bacterium]
MANIHGFASMLLGEESLHFSRLGEHRLTLPGSGDNLGRMWKRFANTRKAIAVVLAGVLFLAGGSLAHAAGHHEQPTHEMSVVQEIGHQHVDAHDHEHAADPSTDNARLDCCDSTGLCSGIAFVIGTDSSFIAPTPEGTALLASAQLLGLYEPGLDLPPPRRS